MKILTDPQVTLPSHVVGNTHAVCLGIADPEHCFVYTLIGDRTLSLHFTSFQQNADSIISMEGVFLSENPNQLWYQSCVEGDPQIGLNSHVVG